MSMRMVPWHESVWEFFVALEMLQWRFVRVTTAKALTTGNRREKRRFCVAQYSQIALEKHELAIAQ